MFDGNSPDINDGYDYEPSEFGEGTQTETVDEPFYVTNKGIIMYPGKEKTVLTCGIMSSAISLGLTLLNLVPGMVFAMFYIGWVPLVLSTISFVFWGIVKRRATKYTSKITVGFILAVVGIVLIFVAIAVGIFSLARVCDDFG